MYAMWNTHHMAARSRFDAQLQTQFLQELAALWPALKGSLTEVRKPCIRPHCPACARGDKHPAFLWTFREQGRRRCLYVPAELVPLLRQGLDNGRRLEARMAVLGSAWLKAWRQQRDAPAPKG
jgi:hypothetical protein